ncbi:DUF3426 domain-containing protein [Microbulbifer sp. TYP-18]|uniref:DUF3426 domain-containing protein n=1 Tax=Microbulbifer sp. TYP-18 TaxID=3230024 RepID=UPI0034C6B73B
MSQLVTRCPHCSTSFHVSEAQLRAARGAVRCGSCLQVFRADENIVFGDNDADRNLEALLEDDDFLIHDNIDLDGDLDTEPSKPLAAEASGPGQGPVIDEAFADSDWQTQTDPTTVIEDSGQAEFDSGELAPDWDPDPQSGEILAPTLDRSPPRDGDGIPSQVEQSLDDRRRQRSFRPEKEPLSAPPDRQRLLSAIEPAPLEMTWRPRRDQRIPGWLWTLLMALLVGGLLAQTAYFRFDSLSKRQPWRDLYALACPQLGCTLPILADTDAIRTANLVVRSHPQLKGALVVDAVLLNTAEFSQPFPNLLLTFSDLQNRAVASRRFAPTDYLQGELAGRKQMPSGNPVHIAIEIVDPGLAAVNYELAIAP